MGCFSCFKSMKPKKSWKCWKGKSPKEEEETSRKRKCMGMCCFCGEKSSKDEESTKKKGSTCCFICKMSSKDEEPSRKRGKCGMMGCFCCNDGSSKEEDLSRKESTCCFICKRSSKDEDLSRKGSTCCFICKRSSKDEEPSRKKGKCRMMGCFCCNGPSKEEDLSRKESTCCFICKRSSKDEEPSEKRGTCGMMGCFCCDGSSKEEDLSKKGSTCCFICKRSSKDEEPSKKRGKCGTGCFCCNGTSKEEEDLSKKGSTCCFICKRSSKDEEPSKKRGKCGTGCFCCNGTSKEEEDLSKKGSTCCFICKRSSKDEEPSRKRGKCGTGCFCCNGSSKEEEHLSRKGGKCGMCCFSSNKPSSQEGCASCLCGGKPPKKEESRGGEEKDSSCCAWGKSSEKKDCFSCLKSTKSRNIGDKATTTKPTDGKPSKWRCLRGMGCLCCFSAADDKKSKPTGKKVCCWKWKKKKTNHLASLVKTISFDSDSGKHRSAAEEILRIGNGNIAARVFTYAELAAATQDFAPECLLGKGGFGKVYKGQLKGTNQIVAVKKLDRGGHQGNREFLIEVLMLSLLSHPNLINLLGYCADGNERILVYDYMPLGSLQDHLLDLSPNSKPLDWNTRMKIAAGAAKGLEHLHDAANPPVIYRDLKASNILLDQDYNPRLADFGLAKLGPVGVKNHVTTRVMGTFGYCAPEYALTGKLTMMSDIYSFGIVLLELITGRKAMDTTRERNVQRLVDWAEPLFKDKKNFTRMADPLLEGNFPVKGLYQALAVAEMCIQKEDTTRPLIKDVVSALQFLAMPSEELPPEPQTEISISGIKDGDSLPRSMHSSCSDWQSCSDTREDEDA